MDISMKKKMASSQEITGVDIHMHFIYSSSFTAVTQSSMVRTVYRQMQFTSPPSQL